MSLFQRTERGLAILTIAVAVQAVLMCGQAKAECQQSYEFVLRTKQALAIQYSGSIFRIVAGRQQGSGFLIDTEQGLVLTALHVVQPAVKDQSAQIVGTSSAFPTREFSFRVVAHLADRSDGPIDAALIKAVNPSELSDLPSIEMGFDLPVVGDEGVGFGYPIPAEGVLGVKQFMFSGQRGGFLQSQYQFEKGFSGGPALTLQGLSVALHAENVEYREHTRHVPFQKVVELVKDISPNQDVDHLTSLVIDDEVSLEQWEEYLKPPPAPLAVSNLELVLAALQLKALETDDRLTRDKLGCLRQAIRQREIFMAAMADSKPFASLSYATAGRDMLNVGQQRTVLAETAQAASAYEQAKRLLGKAVGQDHTQHTAVYAAAACNAGFTIIPKATGGVNSTRIGYLDIRLVDDKAVKIGDCRHAVEGQPRSYTAALLRDYAVASYHIAKTADGAKKKRLAREGIAASLLAVASGETSETKGAAYALLGDISEVVGEHFSAALSYATAYQSGYDPDWLIYNWRHAKSFAFGGDVLDQSQAIADAPVLDNKSGESYLYTTLPKSLTDRVGGFEFDS